MIQVNESQFTRVVRKVRAMAGGSLEDVHVAVWGLTFKAGTDDLRDSPALAITRRLRTAGATVTAYDPTQPRGPEGIEVVRDAYAACQDADVLVILTEWPEFAEADFDKVAELLAEPRIVDTRNLLDPDEMVARGFRYDSIGRATAGVQRRRRADI